MKPSAILGGLAAALIGVSAAHAGALDIVYWGKDSHASVVVDGQNNDLNAADDWITVKPVDAGTHTLTLYANGTSMTRSFTLSSDNVAYTANDGSPGWCLDLEDDGANVLSGDDCDDMMDYYLDGW